MDVIAELERLAGPELAAQGVELVQAEFRRESAGWVLRLYLDKEGGFSLADCESWNDRLGDLIDGAGVIPHAYSLEISSPGLDRPLRKREDFARFMGLDCVVKLSEALSTGQRNFRGKMTSLEGDDLMLFDRTSGLVRIPLASIASARIDPQI